MGNIGIWQLLIVAVIIVLLFGTKKLRGMGGDLGNAIKGFKKAIKEDDKPEQDTKALSEKAQQSQQANKSEDKNKEQA